MTAVRLNWTQIGRIVAWGTANWLLDCACFAMMFRAIDAPIPWKGLLLAYGAGQLAATLPITPGGLGVVEGSITVALVAFGGAETSTAYAVLLYRVISFWMILVIGWLLIGQLALQVRRGRWSRQAMASEVEAGPEAYAAADGGAGGAGGGARVRRGRVRRLGASAAGHGRGGLAPERLLGGPQRPRDDPTSRATSRCPRPPRRWAATHIWPASGSSPSVASTASPPVSTGTSPMTCPRARACAWRPTRATSTASGVSKPFGRHVGTVAVVVVTTPANHLLGTLILTKIPVRFEHMF